MRKKIGLSLLITILTTIMHAATMPEVSTSEKVIWYYVQFSNQKNVLTAQTSGTKVITSMPLGRSTQLWKLEGSSNEGYTLTSKSGLMLYSSTTAQNGMFYAATSPTSNTKVRIVQSTASGYTDSYEIQPFTNTSVSMNQWTGAGSGKDLGLWDKGDTNNPLVFVSEEDYKDQSNVFNITPYPQSLKRTKTGDYNISSLNTITYADSLTKAIATNFATQLKKTSAIGLAIKETGDGRTNNAIDFKFDNTLKDEEYAMTIDSAGITIKAKKANGFFYALQTIKQLLPADIYGTTVNASASWTLPYITIADKPLLEYRGFMIDIARHFFDKSEMKRVIDILSTYKMNRLHWHLTDDQGWRVEIPEYPRLTSVGSIREGSLVCKGNGEYFYDDTEYGRNMWYTLDDLKEIVDYAKEHFIEIIPEIDLPGHMAAAIAAYPEFSLDPSQHYSVRIQEGISHDVLNIGKDTTVNFLKCILGHIAEIFPYNYIHIGGDECPTDKMATNAECLQRVKDESLTGVAQLQSWLVEELGTFLKDKYGKDIVVWDELLSHWDSQNTVKPVIMAWNNISKSKDAADKGFRSIIVPYQSLYFDFMQVSASAANVDELYQGGWGDGYVNTLETVYGLNPLSSLSGKEDYAMGVQGNLWAETLNNDKELEYQLLPRLLALSEIGWLPNAQKNWVSFYTRLQQQAKVFDIMHYTYAKHYIQAPETSEAEAAISEAESIIKASVRGGVGYPSSEIYDALINATNKLKADQANSSATTALITAIATYKTAAITKPTPNKLYQISSASIYYKQKFEGSTIYQSSNTLKIHYTSQLEPEEIWTFEPTSNGFKMKNMMSGKYINLGTYNANTSLTDAEPTEIRIDLASVASGAYRYIPGSLTISAVEGYSATVTGSTKRIVATASGYVKTLDTPALCYPGTWRITEITDFKEQLTALHKKCVNVVETTNAGETGEPTAEAIEYLTYNVITPAAEKLAKGDTVSSETYLAFVELYNNFVDMPRKTDLDVLSESCYYRIRNAWFTNYYATVDKSTKKLIVGTTPGTSDSYKWYIVKSKTNSGAAKIYNKETGSPAYMPSTVQAVDILYGTTASGNLWTIKNSTNDGKTGTAIIDESGVYSWYTNSGAFGTRLIAEPYTWGAAIWTFEKVEGEIVTGISPVIGGSTNADSDVFYDTSGRVINSPANGIYIKKGKAILVE